MAKLLLAGGVAIVLFALTFQFATVPLLVIGAAAFMMGIEQIKPGRNWPRVRGWWWRVVFLNLIQVGVVLVSGVLWDKWMMRNRLWDADWMGPMWGALFGYFVLTFVYYWWHRWRHQFQFLWNWLHQVHHSPQRIEVITSFYKHPLELVTNGLIVSAVCYLICGLGIEAASGTILLAGLAELFYHWNVPTPYWLGYLIQRPESHCVHHQEGLHKYNYGDLPIWDMLFGTFNNPKKFDARCGFGDKEHELMPMLLGVDVNSPDDTDGKVSKS